jgi:uncharacterized membrane protein YqaE (UPF0057 family)
MADLRGVTVIIMPVVGVLMTEGLSKHTILYPREQKSMY